MKNLQKDLFLTFFKIGLFTFGGGYAMLSIISDNCVEKKKWITHDEMMNVTVIAESTPGPISINCATYVGYRQAGLLGGIMCTLGVVLPSFIIIYVISMFRDNFLEYKLIANAFGGIRVCVCVLITNAVLKLFKKAVVDVPTLVIFLAVCVGSILLDVSPVIFVVLAAFAGIILKAMGGKKA